MLLPAVDQRLTFVDRNGRTVRERILLTDGGVFDNLGVTCLEPGRSAEFSYNVFRPDYIICCDAGRGLFTDRAHPYWWGPRMARSLESTFRKAQDASRERLHRLVSAGDLKGFVLAYLGQRDDRLPWSPPDLVRREQVYNYPTDFSPMTDRAIDRLATRGEQLTRLLITHYCPEL